MTNNKKFISLDDLLCRLPEPHTRPIIFYDKDMKVLRLYTKDCSHYEQWIDQTLSIYKDNETDEIVGMAFFMPEPPVVSL